MGQVKIPEELFTKLVLYFLVGNTELHDEIKKAIGDKYNKIVNHQTYTQYKTAPTEAQREEARQKYINQVEIPRDFRW